MDFGKHHPDRYPVHGIDISKWQGEIDWAEVRKAGVAFVFIKATEGGDHSDSRFADYWRGARAAGIPHAPYHFYYFCRPAREQAEWFIANVSRASVQMPPVLDVEWNPRLAHLHLPPRPRDRARRDEDLDGHRRSPLRQAADHLHPRSISTARTSTAISRATSFWLRSVAAHPQDIYPNHPWTFWQYTGTGMMPGIKGDTDINAFAGSRKQWQEWLKKYAR